MFIYAWCAYPTITWVAQAIGIVLFTTAAFVIYNGVFSYLADWSVAFDVAPFFFLLTISLVMARSRRRRLQAKVSRVCPYKT